MSGVIELFYNELVKALSRKERHRNYLPALMMALVWWWLLLGLVMLVDPATVADWPVTGSYFIFFLLLFLAAWFTGGLIFAKSRRGLVTAIGVVIFGYLRLIKVGTVLNLVLLAGAVLAFEIYFSRGEKSKSDNLID